MSQIVSSEVTYKQLLTTIKQQVKNAHAKAALAINNSLIQLYWSMGKMIAENQALFEGRNNYVEQLAKDLRAEFPEMKGFSKRNIFYFRKFYLFYSIGSVQQVAALKVQLETEPVQQVAALKTESSVQQPVGFNFDILGVPWGHHMLVLDKTKTEDEAHFQLHQTIENNWSRAILTLQIEQDLYRRQGKATTNFHQTLPEKQALTAGQILKDPYNFSFLTLEPQAQELDVERQLTEQITRFLLELGKGFAFIGRQYNLQCKRPTNTILFHMQ
jgi:predicted nuclease of restriction endonuclease-like (RecB) superfamily